MHSQSGQWLSGLVLQQQQRHWWNTLLLVRQEAASPARALLARGSSMRCRSRSLSALLLLVLGLRRRLRQQQTQKAQQQKQKQDQQKKQQQPEQRCAAGPGEQEDHATSASTGTSTSTTTNNSNPNAAVAATTGTASTSSTTTTASSSSSSTSFSLTTAAVAVKANTALPRAPLKQVQNRTQKRQKQGSDRTLELVRILYDVYCLYRAVSALLFVYFHRLDRRVRRRAMAGSQHHHQPYGYGRHQQQGVDLSTIPRQNLYATPKTPTSGAASHRAAAAAPKTLGTAPHTYSTTTTSSSSRIPTSAGSVYSSAVSRGGDGRGYVPPGSNAGRKRSRLNTATGSPLKLRNGYHGVGSTNVQNDRSSTFSPPPPADYLTPGPVSPAPLANSRYDLANGFDTPTAAQADAYDRPVFSAEADRTKIFRRLRDDELDRPSYAHGLDGARDVAGPLARRGNGQGDDGSQNGFGGEDEVIGAWPKGTDEFHTPRRQMDGEDASRWSVRRALVNTVTGVAGFVFHFCTAGAFRGFTAGGGQGWTFSPDGQGSTGAAKPADLTPSHPKHARSSSSISWSEKSGLHMDDSWQDTDFPANGTQTTQQYQPPTSRTSTSPIYSYFDPAGAGTGSTHTRPSPAGTPRAAKKLKSSHTDDGAVRGNWILVGTDTDSSRQNSRSGSPNNNSSASPAGLRRKTNHAGTGTPRQSFGGPLVSTPGRQQRRRFTATLSMPLNGGSPASVSVIRQASAAALRSPGVRDSGRRSRAGSRASLMGPGAAPAAGGGADRADGTASPLGKEGDRLLRLKEKREREEERELTRMNRRLEEMIRQGREALGTRYEVELEDEDGMME